MLLSILSILTIIGYIGLSAYLWHRWTNSAHPYSQWRWWAIALPVIVLNLLAVSDTIFPGEGQNLTIVNVALLSSFGTCLALTLAYPRFAVALLLPPVYLLNGLLLGIDLFTHARYIMHIEYKPYLLIHLTLAIGSYVMLVVAALLALQIGWIRRYLKGKSPAALHPGLPPLMTVERQLMTLLVIGFALLTLSICTGFIFMEVLHTHAHKALFTMIAWLMYLVAIWKQRRAGLTNRALIIITVGGAILLTIAYYGSRVIREWIINGNGF